MTKRGLIYIAVLALLLTLSYGTGIRELHMISCCMLFLLAYSLLSALLAAMSVVIKHEISARDVSRNNSVVFTVNLKGFVILPITGDVYIAVPGKVRRRLKDADHYVFYKFFGIFKKQFTFELPCDNKGLWYVGIKRLRVHDVFGLMSFPLFFCPKMLGKRYEVRVHPNVYTPETENLMPQSKIGVSAAALKESDAGDSVSGSRQYRYGDPFKRINWKQTARTHEVYVRNFELEQNPQVLIITDNSAPSHYRASADIAADVAASLNKYYIGNGSTIRNMMLRVNQKNRVREADCYVKNETDYSALDNLLMTTPPSFDGNALNIPLLDTAAFSSANIIHVISADPSVELLSSLSSLKENDFIVTCVVPLRDESRREEIEKRSNLSGFEPIFIENPAEIITEFGGKL